MSRDCAVQSKPPGEFTGVWRMRSGQLVTVLPIFAPAGRYFEQLSQRTWNADGRSREDKSWDLIERIPGPGSIRSSAAENVDSSLQIAENVHSSAQTEPWQERAS